MEVDTSLECCGMSKLAPGPAEDEDVHSSIGDEWQAEEGAGILSGLGSGSWAFIAGLPGSAGDLVLRLQSAWYGFSGSLLGAASLVATPCCLMPVLGDWCWRVSACAAA